MHNRRLSAFLFLLTYACDFYSIFHIYGSENDTNDSRINKTHRDSPAALRCSQISQAKNVCKIMLAMESVLDVKYVFPCEIE